MKFVDYYAVLGISPDADYKAVKVAYKKLARKYHPDVSKEPQAEEKFKEIGEAYEVIHNKEERAKYDVLRRNQQNRAQQQANYGGSYGSSQNHYQQGDPQADQEFSDFVNSMFGGAGGFNHGGQGRTGGARAQKGQDVEIEFPVFLEETLVDTVKPIEFMLPQRDSSGRVSEVKKSLKVKIPAGSVNGERIRLKGQGGLGSANGPNGDLYLQIRLVPHPLFDVEGHNLNIVVPLAPWEAALGTKINLPTLAGKIQLTIPANSQSGQRLRIKGKGLISKKAKGDLFAVIKIVNPALSDDVSKKLWQELAEKAHFDPRSNWSKS
ncbi:DnaJ domain-containing protein [Pseudoalteromonas sp. MIP2626]|uniref:DnaJ C-terminal domain-containing protein n=1 Tax=Pseudoalteromonas TaxID=53246 RepID=UPI0015CCAE91|nr:DnaJ C-terminal domain-containing protein [Pseudoalteromonas sp. MIP2626]NYR13543.1 DnaJ domain-containing protein [Pseudoalteromonas sp. MIP2626]